MENAYRTFLELAEGRYSVRKFSDRKVEPETVQQILHAAQAAPTACNLQPQRILVMEDADTLTRLRKCTMSHFSCTLAMLVCCDTGACWTREYDGKTSGDIDAAIVTTHLMLAAHALGVGSTWVMHFIPEAIREELSLPAAYEPVSLLVMGYPAEDARPYPAHASRKPLSETVFHTRFDA